MTNYTSTFDTLRRRAEELLNDNYKPQEFSSDSSLDLHELIHELEVHQMELEMQHIELQDSHRRLDENRQLYRDLFDFAPNGYIVTDKKGIILNVNLTLTAMFAMHRIELEGRSIAKFIEDSYVDTYYLNRQSVFETGQAQTCEVLLDLPNKQGFFARLDSTLIAEKEQCRIALTNISQQKQTEQALKNALEKERQLNDLKSRLLNMITHEFGTPLTIILTSIDILEKYEAKLDEQSKETRFRRVRDAVWHMTHMVSQISSTYRTETDTVSLTPITFDLEGMLQALVTDLNLINQDRVLLNTKKDSVSDCLVDFDLTLLRQILSNIIDNSLKYSDDKVRVNLKMLTAVFIVTITDTGIGIPQEDQDHIFDTFFRATNSTTTAGTGIGLSIVKRLVQACHGSIEVQSKVGTGTTFSLRFPRRIALA